jgi:hypothetical protein
MLHWRLTGLLESNGGRSSIMRCNIDIDPRHIQPRSVIHSHGAEECREISDSILRNGKKDDVANNAKDICKQNELNDLDQYAAGQFIRRSCTHR